MGEQRNSKPPSDGGQMPQTAPAGARGLPAIIDDVEDLHEEALDLPGNHGDLEMEQDPIYAEHNQDDVEGIEADLERLLEEVMSDADEEPEADAEAAEILRLNNLLKTHTSKHPL